MLNPVETIGSYQVEAEVGRGAQGVVYRARDRRGRSVALKRLLDADDDPRFWQELEASTRLKHPHVVRTLAFDRDAQGQAFMVMELVEGETLRQRILRDGPLPFESAVAFLLQLCDAVDHAHDSGVIHRDLKPQNVLIDRREQAKLTDFGLGKVVDQSRHLTQTGELLGTPAYMPPEQVRGERDRVGRRSDVYALGATLYVTLCGEVPFRGVTLAHTLAAVLHEEPDPPSAIVPSVPAWLDAICLRCLAKDPDDRYASASELAAALRGGGPPRRRGSRRHAVVGLLIALAGAALGGAVLWRGRADPIPVRARKAHARGVAALKLDDLERARVAFDQALALAPDFAQALSDRGALLAHVDRDAALRDLDRAIALAPQSAEAYRHRAELHLETRTDAALADLQRAWALDPSDPRTLLNIGLCHYHRGEDPQAVEFLDRALALDPAFAEAYTNRGAARTRLGLIADALADFTRALELDPENGYARYNRGALRVQQGDLDGALADLRLAAELRPENPMAHGLIGQCLMLQRDYAAAIDPLERALRLGSESLSAENERGLRSQLELCRARRSE